MKLYLISQEVNNNYDTFDRFVVCAENEEKAKLVHELDNYPFGAWVRNVDDITVEYIGEARDGMGEGEILGSFNAG